MREKWKIQYKSNFFQKKKLKPLCPPPWFRPWPITDSRTYSRSDNRTNRHPELTIRKKNHHTTKKNVKQNSDQLTNLNWKLKGINSHTQTRTRTQTHEHTQTHTNANSRTHTDTHTNSHTHTTHEKTKNVAVFFFLTNWQTTY